MRLLLLFILSTFGLLHAQIDTQNPYPQNYFTSPLEVPLILSGTFAELRSNHFHSGLDIKTQGRVGLKVKASAGGYVSRIKVSHYGYGKALYITHPNGYTTVYAHLQKFSPDIEAYVKKRQYAKETFQIELFPKKNTLIIEKNATIAYSGNTGGSGGAHLHFEIRDNQERPINPMYFGFNIKDNIKPLIRSIYAYPLSDDASVNGTNKKIKLKLTPLKNGEYIVKNVKAYGKIGFGINTIDRLDYAANKNGVAKIETFLNGNKNFEIDFKRFAFSETKHINKLIDYGHYKTNRERIQKLYKDNNPLSLYKNLIDQGFLFIEDSTNMQYKIRVSDFKNNESWITVSIKGEQNKTVLPKQTVITPYYINSNENKTLNLGNATVNFYKNTFYKNLYLNIKNNNDTLILHKDIVPLKKKFTINFNIERYNNTDKNKLYIARLVGAKKVPYYISTKRKDAVLSASTKILGTHTLCMDLSKPSIKPYNFKNGQWLSKYRFLKIKISDKGSGVSNYRATVNGKWILMEYDYKKRMLTHDFNDACITDTKNLLKVIVTDNVGNSNTFESVFYRK